MLAPAHAFEDNSLCVFHAKMCHPFSISFPHPPSFSHPPRPSLFTDRSKRAASGGRTNTQHMNCLQLHLLLLLFLHLVPFGGASSPPPLVVSFPLPSHLSTGNTTLRLSPWTFQVLDLSDTPTRTLRLAMERCEVRHLWWRNRSRRKAQGGLSTHTHLPTPHTKRTHIGPSLPPPPRPSTSTIHHHLLLLPLPLPRRPSPHRARLE